MQASIREPVETEQSPSDSMEDCATVELLGSILRGGQAIERAVTLHDQCGGLLALDRADPRQLCRIPGIGPASAAVVVAALELGRRVASLRIPYGRTVERADCDDIASFLRARIGSARQEVFLALGLDARRRLQLVRTIAIGSVSRVHVEPHDVFRPLVQAGMRAVIVAHNHPSGTAEPSKEDVAFTQRLVRAGRVLGIEVIDHVVVTRYEVVSLAGLGVLVPSTRPSADGCVTWTLGTRSSA